MRGQLFKYNLPILYSIIPTLRSVALLPRSFRPPLPFENSASALRSCHKSFESVENLSEPNDLPQVLLRYQDMFYDLNRAFPASKTRKSDLNVVL